jgi:hypothetical protein
MPHVAHRVLRPVLGLVLLGAVYACGPKSASSSSRPRTDPSVMDSVQLRDHGYGSVYDAISAQHSDWLLPRGGPANGQAPAVGVFVDGAMRPREISYLRELRPSDIKRVKHLSITESTSMYNWLWGALVITTR